MQWKMGDDPMNNYCLVTLFAFLIISISSAQIQEIRFEHLDTKNGLASESVDNILQDRSGFMWFATRDGLHRYALYNHRAACI